MKEISELTDNELVMFMLIKISEYLNNTGVNHVTMTYILSTQRELENRLNRSINHK